MIRAPAELAPLELQPELVDAAPGLLDDLGAHPVARQERDAMRHRRDPSEVGHEPRTRHASMPPDLRGAPSTALNTLAHGPGRPSRTSTTSTSRPRSETPAPAAPGKGGSGARRSRVRARSARAQRAASRDVAARHAKAEAGLRLPEHRLPVEAKGTIKTFSPGWTTVCQRSAWKSAGRSSSVTPEAAVEARQRASAPGARRRASGPGPACDRNSATSTASAEPREHERACRQRVAREGEVVDERPGQRQPGAVARHHEARAERADRREDDVSGQDARQRLAPPLPERKAGERRQHRPEVADLLGQVVASESARRAGGAPRAGARSRASGRSGSRDPARSRGR